MIEILPLHRLRSRASQAKSPKERHDLDYYAWELAVRLAVATRTLKQPAALRVPSMGHWVTAVEAPAEKTTRREYLDLYQLLGGVAYDSRSAPKNVSPRQLLEALAGYRNAVVGHGAPRSSEFYDTSSTLLGRGLDAALEDGWLVPRDARLVFVLPAAGERLRGLELGRAIRAFDMDRPGAIAGRLYFISDAQMWSLHPWVLFRQTAQTEQLLFFNGMRGATPRYLDFLSGEELRGDALKRAFPNVTKEMQDLIGAADGDDTADDDFEELGAIGRGGMGVVALARQKSLDRLVAIKTLPQELTDDPVARARFEREANALSRCDHPNVVKIISSTMRRGSPFFAMEFVQGATLDDVLRRAAIVGSMDEAVRIACDEQRSRLPALQSHYAAVARDARPASDERRRFIEIMRDAALGAAHLHDQGIVHRDLKPSNLMLTEGELRVVVMDLGLATTSNATLALTQQQGVAGTLRYAAPEQVLGEEVDRRADVYALGAILYEAIAKRPMRTGETEPELLRSALEVTPPPLDKIDRKISADRARVVEKATQRERGARYETAHALAEDLDALLAGNPIRARRPSLAYVSRLYIKRHRALSSTIAAAFFLAIAGITAFVIVQARLRSRAEDQRVIAERALLDTRITNARSEIAAHEPFRALPWLLAAYAQDPTRVETKFLLNDVAHETDALVGYVNTRGVKATTAGGFALVDIGSKVIARSLWDTRKPCVVEGLPSLRGAVTLSPSGERVMRVDGKKVSVWKLDGCTHEGAFEMNATLPKDVVWSRSGNAIAAWHDLVVEVFDPQGKRVAVHDFNAEVAPLRSLGRDPFDRDRIEGDVALSPSGDRVLVNAALKTFVWSIREGSVKVLGELALSNARFSSDDVFTTNDVLTGTKAHALAGDSPPRLIGRAELGGVSRLLTAASPDGRTLITVGSLAGSALDISIWPIDPNNGVGASIGHADFGDDRSTWGNATTLAVHWDRHMLAVGFEPASAQEMRLFGPHRVVIVDFTDPSAPKIRAHVPQPSRPLSVLQMDADASRIALITDRDVWTWRIVPDAANWEAQSSALAIAANGDRVLIGGERGWSLRDKTGKVLRAEAGWHGEGAVTADAIAPDEKTFALGFADGSVEMRSAQDGLLDQRVRSGDERHKLWPESEGLKKARTDAKSEAVTRLAFDARSKSLAILGKGWLPVLFNPERGHAKLIAPDVAEQYDAAVFPDGSRVLFGGADAVARVWDSSSGRVVHSLKHDAPINGVAVNEAGTRAVTASDDGTVRIFDTSSGGEIGRCEAHSGPASRVVIAKDGKRIYSAGADGVVAICDLLGKRIGELRAEGEAIEDFSVSPSERFAAARSKHSFTLWDVESRAFLRTFELSWNATAMGLGDDLFVVGATSGFAAVPLTLEKRTPTEVRAYFAGRSPWTLTERGTLELVREEGEGP